MGRCPVYLNVDDFERLANSMGVKLTDDGVSSFGEITEFIAKQILETSRNGTGLQKLGINDILSSATKLGIELDVDQDAKRVRGAKIRVRFDADRSLKRLKDIKLEMK